MKRMKAVLLTLVTVSLGACATTEFKSVWKDPSVQHLEFQGKRVATFVVTKDVARRRAAEDALANELQKRGVRAAPGYQLIPDENLTNKEAIRQRLEAMGIEGAVVMRIVDRRQEVSYVPPSGPYYGSFYGYWDYGWAATASPGYMRSDTIVSVETLVYSVPQDKLLWGGVSETTDPGKLDKFVREVVDATAKEMKKAGLISGQ